MSYLEKYYNHYFKKYTGIKFSDVPKYQKKIISDSVEFKNYLFTEHRLKNLASSIKKCSSSLKALSLAFGNYAKSQKRINSSQNLN